MPLHVWGSGWYEMMPEHKDVVDSTFMPNEKLPALYRSAKVTLNDHWKDMLITRSSITVFLSIGMRTAGHLRRL